MFYKEVKRKKVRNGIYAIKTDTATIIIEEQIYYFYSLSDAIAKYRRDFPAYKKRR